MAASIAPSTAQATDPAAGESVWSPQRLITYPLIEHVDLAPDGTALLYTMRRPHLTDDCSEFRRTVYRAAVTPDGPTTPQPLTHDADATQPRWSPDGAWIAFLRPTPDTGKPGLWVMPAHGGEAWPLTGEGNGIRHAVTRFAWNPDGGSIAFTAVPWDDERETKRRGGDDAWRWRHDYDRAHLHLVPVVGTGEPLPPAQALTAGPLHVQGFTWRPDGQEIAIIHQPTPYIDTWSASRVATLAVSTADTPALRDLGEAASWDGDLAYSPDGAWLACAVGEEDHAWPYACHIVLFDLQGHATPRRLADVSDTRAKLVGWAADGSAVYVKDDQGLGVAVLALPVDGGAAQTLLAADHLITATHVNAQGKLAYAREDYTTPQSVWVADPAQGTAATPVTPPPVVAGALPQVRELRWQTPDGLSIEGILYLPADYDPATGARIPLLLHVHGGPSAVFQRQYAGTPYYYTPAALAAQGIALLRCNPRGSGGYGKDFRYANVADWGGADFRDLMQGVDTVIEMGIADPDRLGICGWSYGGYMTSWTITQTHRFKAASIGAGVTNLISFIGTSDIPSFVPGYFGGEIWERGELLQARSPLFQAHKARTPALIQHGEADERVPLEQGLQYGMALERNGIPVETILYPRQGHAINEPRLLADAIARNLAWFGARLASAAP